MPPPEVDGLSSNRGHLLLGSVVDDEYVALTVHRHPAVRWEAYRVQTQQLRRHRHAGLHHTVIGNQSGNDRHRGHPRGIIRVGVESQAYDTGLIVDGPMDDAAASYV